MSGWVLVWGGGIKASLYYNMRGGGLSLCDGGHSDAIAAVEVLLAC